MTCKASPVSLLLVDGTGGILGDDIDSVILNATSVDTGVELVHTLSPSLFTTLLLVDDVSMGILVVTVGKITLYVCMVPFTGIHTYNTTLVIP